MRVGGLVVRQDEVVERLAKNFAHSRGGDLAVIASRWEGVELWLLLPFVTDYAKIKAYRRQ